MKFHSPFVAIDRKARREYLAARIAEVKNECARIDELERQRIRRLNRPAITRGSYSDHRLEFGEVAR